MLTIARLFGKSPFAPLQSHMNKVASCLEKLAKIFESLNLEKTDKVEHLAADLSQLEHEADLTKNDIRNHLPKSLFMPIDRSHFLEILSLQDSVADFAEQVGITLSYRPLADYSLFREELNGLFAKVSEVFWGAKRIIEEIDELLEASFGGLEAQKVKRMIEEIAYKEHKAQKKKQELLCISEVTSIFKLLPYASPRFIERRVEKGIFGRVLTERTPETMRLMKKPEKKELRETRFIKGLKDIPMIEYIHGDDVSIVSTNIDNPLGIIIRHADFAKEQRVLFELLWKTAEK